MGLLSSAIAIVILFVSAVFAQPAQPPQYSKPVSQDSVWDAPDGIDPAVRETDVGRWVLPHRELMQRTYDVSGQKSEWVLGTSILGNPELDPYTMGIGSVSQRFPSKLSGLYATRLGYDATRLSLNGENGILFEERHGIPVDTPITDLAWERSTFEGNALRLDFRRLVTDSVAFELGIQSHSNMGTKEYAYQNVTHSPYFSLGRDSTNIPFGGRNIEVNTMHLQPMLTWRFGLGKAFFKMNYLSLENRDNTSHRVLLDTLDKSVRTFQTNAFTIDQKSVTYGTGLEFYPVKNFTIGTSIHYGTHEIEMDSLGTLFKDTLFYVDTLGKEHTDSIYYDTTRAYTYETILGEFHTGMATLLNPTIKFEYEFLNTDEELKNRDREFYQDREVGYLQLADTLGIVMFRTQMGMQRNSSLFDEVDFAPAYSADATVQLPFHFRLNGTFRHDNKFPDVWQQKFTEVGRVSFPREDLKTEVRNRQTANLGWYSREVFYGLGFRHETAEDLIRQRWVKGYGLESVERAFQWSNVGEVESYDWLFQVGFRLGNWKFFLERGQTLDRDYKLLDTPELYYKGSIHWQNRFVYDRLGVSVRVDWQWFDNRYDCTINEQGLPELQEMHKYLALDFEARMQILSFELYNRIENFNHSIYMPAAGYTPEGLRFAYGIVWTFRN